MVLTIYPGFLLDLIWFMGKPLKWLCGGRLGSLNPRLKPWAMVTGCFWFCDHAKFHVKYFHVDVRQFVIWLDKSGLKRRIIIRMA